MAFLLLALTAACCLRSFAKAYEYNDPVPNNGWYCGHGTSSGAVAGYQFLQNFFGNEEQCKAECGNDPECVLFVMPIATSYEQQYVCGGVVEEVGPCCQLVHVDNAPRDAPSSDICPDSAGGYARATNSYRLWTKAFTTAAPTAAPSKAPTTAAPTAAPSKAPTTAAPTAAPTKAPTTAAPTAAPTQAPSPPTASPTTGAPTSAPSFSPTTTSPTSAPTSSPTSAPTSSPTYVPECLTEIAIQTIFTDPGAPSDGMFKLTGINTTPAGAVSVSIELDENMENRQLLLAIRTGTATTAATLTPDADCDFNVATSSDLTIPAKCFIGSGGSGVSVTAATIFVGIGGYKACGAVLTATSWTTLEDGTNWIPATNAATPEFWRSDTIAVTQFLSNNELTVSYDLDLESFNALFKPFDGTDLDVTIRYDLSAPTADFCADNSGYPKTFDQCADVQTLAGATGEIPRIDDGNLLLRFTLTPADCALLKAESGTHLGITDYAVQSGAMEVTWEFDDYASTDVSVDRCVVLANTLDTLREDTAVQFTFQVQGTSRRRQLRIAPPPATRGLQSTDAATATIEGAERSDTYYFVVEVDTDVAAVLADGTADEEADMSKEMMTVIVVACVSLVVVVGACAATAIALLYSRSVPLRNRVHGATSGVVTAVVEGGAASRKWEAVLV